MLSCAARDEPSLEFAEKDRHITTQFVKEKNLGYDRIQSLHQLDSTAHLNKRTLVIIKFDVCIRIVL